MARPTTVTRVHSAVLELAERGGPSALTMEGIAAEAGVSKQTLYRTWPSVHAILFDALSAESADAGTSEDHATTFEILQATITELHTEPRASLLRTLTAAIQTDDEVSRQFHVRLLQPQHEQIRQVVAADGFTATERAAELLISPLLFRWLLRLPPLTDGELRAHIDSVRELALPRSNDVTD